jgi:hypothetical protein
MHTFVFATGYGKDAPIVSSSAFPWIAKPFTKNAIETALRSALETRPNAQRLTAQEVPF